MLSEIVMLPLSGMQSSMSPKIPFPNFEDSVCNRFPSFRNFLKVGNICRYISSVASGKTSDSIDRVTCVSSQFLRLPGILVWFPKLSGVLTTYPVYDWVPGPPQSWNNSRIWSHFISCMNVTLWSSFCITWNLSSQEIPFLRRYDWGLLRVLSLWIIFRRARIEWELAIVTKNVRRVPRCLYPRLSKVFWTS